jgi:hypothetical protein
LCRFRKSFGVHKLDVDDCPAGAEATFLKSGPKTIDLPIEGRESRMVGTDKQDAFGLIVCMRRRDTGDHQREYDNYIAEERLYRGFSRFLKRLIMGLVRR